VVVCVCVCVCVLTYDHTSNHAKSTTPKIDCYLVPKSHIG
jgi:hypothetical protein